MARSSKNRQVKLSYSIIVDGKTEVWYFQMMKKHERLPRVDIVPEIPKKKSLEEQYETVIEKAKVYDKVFWIIDLDTVLKEDRERKKGSVPKIKRLSEYRLALSKNHKEIVVVAINNPCLELWYLLHYRETNKYFPDCNKVTEELKQHLTDYEKTERYYKKKSSDIYKRLKPYQTIAKENSSKLGNFNFEKPEETISEMNRILSLLEL
jgi:hypothetical protein